MKLRKLSSVFKNIQPPEKLQERFFTDMPPR